MRDDRKSYFLELYCALCGKDLQTAALLYEGDPVKAEYCHDCIRAVRIAQMQAAGKLPTP